MSAEVLRRAADRLDALVDDVHVWTFSDLMSITDHCLPTADADYIAAMSREVGKALAAWLRDVSAFGDPPWPESVTSAPRRSDWVHALVVARAILRGAA